MGYIVFTCPSCNTTRLFSVEQVRKKFTVYFIPTFSYSRKQYLTCTTCQATFEVPKELKPEIEQNLMSQEEVSSLIEQINEETAKPKRKSRTATKKLSPAKSISRQQAKKSAPHYCPSCGRKVSGTMAYCPSCGGKLKLPEKRGEKSES